MTVTYNQEQFEEYKAKYKKLNYIKTDKNGTEYYEGVCKCPRCDGVGIVYKMVLNGEPIPHTPESGRCFLCGGARVVDATIKVFTPEHEAKLVKQRAKRNPDSLLTPEEKAEKFRQEKIQRNHDLGYKPIDFTLDAWVEPVSSVYKVYRVAYETARAILVKLMYSYEEYDGMAHERWLPKTAIHFQEETK